MKRRSLKLNERTCFCNPTTKKQLVAVTGCSDDLAAVSALPDDWVPRNSSPVLINYLKDQVQNHEDVLRNLAEEAKCINLDIDGKVRNIAEILLSDIQQNDTDIEAVLTKYQSNNQPLTTEDRANAIKEITKLSTQRVDDLIKFKQECLGVERLRAEGLKNILKCQFQRLIAVGYKPPTDLLHEFDEQIYDINHQLLSNSRAYIELEAQFRLQLDERVVRAKSLLNQICLNGTKSVRGESSLPWIKRLSFSQKEFNTDDNKSQILKHDSSLVKTNLEEIKNTISKIVDSYDAACFKVLKEFSDRLDNLYNNISITSFSIRKSSDAVNFDNNDDSVGLTSIYNERFNSGCNIIDNALCTDLSNLQKKFSSFIKLLYGAYSMLSDLCHILNDHKNRSSLVQKFTLLGLDDIQTIQDALELSNEVNFNVALEQMRCAPDHDKLQQQFDIVTNYLNKKTETFYQQKEVENAKLEDFMKLPSTMSQVLQAEFNCFLDKHPKVPNQTYQPTEHSSTPTDSVLAMQEFIPLRMPLLHAILQTQLQEQEVVACTNSCLESFGNIFLTIPDVLNDHSREWVDTKCSLVNMRSTLKLISHSVRAERVKVARENRAAEIRFHDMRLNSHLDAMYNLIDRLSMEASEFSAIDAPGLYPFCKWISDIKLAIDTLLVKESIDPEHKRLKMSSYALRLVRHRELFEESLEKAINEHKRNIEREIQRARILNVRFMSRLKLFFEGGRYAAAEAIRSCTALVKAGDALETSLNRTMEALHQRRTQLLAMADQQMLPLQRIVEEFSKYGAKSAVDKKKLPINKSK